MGSSRQIRRTDGDGRLEASIPDRVALGGLDAGNHPVPQIPHSCYADGLKEKGISLPRLTEIRSQSFCFIGKDPAAGTLQWRNPFGKGPLPDDHRAAGRDGEFASVYHCDPCRGAGGRIGPSTHRPGVACGHPKISTSGKPIHIRISNAAVGHDQGQPIHIVLAIKLNGSRGIGVGSAARNYPESTRHNGKGVAYRRCVQDAIRGDQNKILNLGQFKIIRQSNPAGVVGWGDRIKHPARQEISQRSLGRDRIGTGDERMRFVEDIRIKTADQRIGVIGITANLQGLRRNQLAFRYAEADPLSQCRLSPQADSWGTSHIRRG